MPCRPHVILNHSRCPSGTAPSILSNGSARPAANVFRCPPLSAVRVPDRQFVCLPDWIASITVADLRKPLDKRIRTTAAMIEDDVDPAGGGVGVSNRPSIDERYIANSLRPGAHDHVGSGFYNNVD